MTLAPQRSPQGRPLPPIPATWPGSDLEWYTRIALIQLGYKEGDDFIYQAPFAGGRQVAGGSVGDFALPKIRVVLNPQGRYWHNTTAEQRGHDALQRAQYEGMGWRIEYPQEEDMLNNPRATIARCIAGTYGRGPLGN